MKAEPTKYDDLMDDEVMKKRFKRIEELQAFNKSEAGKAFFEKQKEETAIAEFRDILTNILFRNGFLTYDESKNKLKKKTNLEIEQAARNLYEKAIRKDFINRVDSKLKADEKKCKDCMVHYRKMSPLYKKYSVEIEEAKQQTASAIENVKIDIWNDAIFKARLLWSGDFDLFYSNIEKIKKKHLETK